MEDNKISGIIKASLSNIKEIVDSNTIIGDAITAPGGTVILPVSKVTVGLASGGIDYQSKKASSTPLPANFGGGGGTGISVTPIAFLVVRPDGGVDLLNVETPTDPVSGDIADIIASFVRRSPELITRIKNAFKSDAKTDAAQETPEPDEDIFS